MNVFIPHHLRNIPIIEQLYTMIESYSTYIENQDLGSFDNYYNYLTIDPVKAFVRLNIKESDISKEEDYESVINYITRLFYSVKGTIKVFEFMSKYLKLNLKEDFHYSPRYVKVSFSCINTVNDTIFYKTLEEFLKALLYFSDYETNITTNDLIINDTIESFVGSNIVTYNIMIPNSYEIWKN